ncbi:hypothetical protein XNC1_0286 [Xenorhabdus nematophila ATCC 19061]|uniref:Uncharacterized protein n=1 Tax=Xenorhabdus nematophila (strain ATCC 19061 / DSM 3370 / CCUG 14189 / LMG 1036 / NCIMB 9965 / AN6) TaxID=406817 RepID=D3VH84_XENNA|nr:hypothetical protein XNC1_0286 [Xenorhabdus nematophila ATCC 19061]CEK21287.1 hypothetical protein XNC2_0285 [Xenorhabdus nematophila AN6/1]
MAVVYQTLHLKDKPTVNQCLYLIEKIKKSEMQNATQMSGILTRY